MKKKCVLFFVIGTLFLMFQPIQAQISPENNILFQNLPEQFQVPQTVMPLFRTNPGSWQRYSSFDSTLANLFQNTLDSLLAVHNIVGASASIIMPEKGTWLGVSGYSTPSTGKAMHPDMLLDIGSNTKTFMSVLMLLLAEDGLVTLEDPLSRWLPTFPNIDSTITIRQLLNHTSGISDFSNENPEWGAAIDLDYEQYWSPEYSLSFVLKPNFPPGASWSYSNTNYILAGMIIREVTASEQISPVLRERILNPLGLNSTFLYGEDELVGELANGWLYNENENGWYNFSEIPRTAIYSSLWTAGAMVSTADDLARFARALYRGDILAPVSMAQLFTLFPINQGTTIGYGLGTMKERWDGENVWLHGGDTFNFGSQAVYWPRRDVGIALIVNQRNVPYRLWHDILTTRLFEVVKDYYLTPYDQIYPQYAELSQTYVKPMLDTLTIRTQLNNPENHDAYVVAEIQSLDGSYIDSTILKQDPLAENVFVGMATAPSLEAEFTVSIHTEDLETHYRQDLENSAQFTSIGPIVFDHFEFSTMDSIPNPGDTVYIKLYLKNESLTTEAANISATLASLDTLLAISRYPRSCGNIAPSESRITNGFYKLSFDENCPDSMALAMAVEISSNGNMFWADTFSVMVTNPVTSVTTISTQPQRYTLEQNFPNPFNPTTTIQYQLPTAGPVELTIYSVTGQEIATLVSEEQAAGNYQIRWNAAQQASGLYFYRLRAGEFEQIRKLMLVK